MTKSQPNQGAAMLELAERCEKATGPDRIIDYGIRYALKGAPTPAGITKVTRNGGYETVHFENGGVMQGAEAPSYTASLDAALTLVPEGLIMALTNCDADGPKPVFGKASAIVGNPDDTGEPVVAATMALALSAASLKVRAKAAQ